MHWLFKKDNSEAAAVFLFLGLVRIITKLLTQITTRVMFFYYRTLLHLIMPHTNDWLQSQCNFAFSNIGGGTGGPHFYLGVWPLHFFWKRNTFCYIKVRNKEQISVAF